MSKILDEKTAYALERGTFVGILEGLPSEQYHKNKNYYSSSDLKFLASRSPAHFYARMMGEQKEKKQTEKMLLGSVVHSKFLTPTEFPHEYYVMPEHDARTKEGKKIREESLEAAGVRTVISSEVDEQSRAMVESLAMKFGGDWQRSRSELSLFWRCPFSQLYFKARLDMTEPRVLYELKTTEDAAPAAFSRHAYNMNYDLSIHHYMEGMRQCGLEVTKAVFIVSETTEPYVCEKYTVGDGFMETGHAKWLSAVQKLENGLKNHHWPSHVDPLLEIETVIQPPVWAMKKGFEDG